MSLDIATQQTKNATSQTREKGGTEDRPLQMRPLLSNDIPEGQEHLKLPTLLTQPCEHGFS